MKEYIYVKLGLFYVLVMYRLLFELFKEKFFNIIIKYC